MHASRKQVHCSSIHEAAAEAISISVPPTANPWGIILLILLIAIHLGCTNDDLPQDAVARVGKAVLTKEHVTTLAGVPYDSLLVPERFRVIQSWVERTLLDLEGERRGFAKNPEIQQRLAALRAELYGMKLLGEQPAEIPPDSVVEAYYDEHQSEFLRPEDAYLIELYWGETEDEVREFCAELLEGDTARIVEGVITPEGRWLAEHGELDSAVAAELSRLRPGQLTQPRPYEDGFRVMKLVESYRAGAVLDLDVVRDEIIGRMLVEQSKARQARLFSQLKKQWKVEIYEK